MKERPILFSGPMIPGILDGSKIQTRRLVKAKNDLDIVRLINMEAGVLVRSSIDEMIRCSNPYGQPGDRLWVREAFCRKYFDNGNHAYKADWNSTAAEYVTEPKWKPSIHMPRSMSRILLEVVDVRIERLHDIGPVDALKEGIREFTKDGNVLKYGLDGWEWASMPRTAVAAFFRLWDCINGAESTNANPWVWVVEFKRIQS